jgi:hypothetical protein
MHRGFVTRTHSTIAKRPNFTENRICGRWKQWRLHRDYPPRRRWRVHTVTVADIVNRSAWHTAALTNEYGPSPGAYVVCRGDEVLYVGSTRTSLRARLRNHHCIFLDAARWNIEVDTPTSATAFFLRRTDAITFYECRDWMIAQALENELIELFRPVYARRAPRFVPTLVRFLERRRQTARDGERQTRAKQ